MHTSSPDIEINPIDSFTKSFMLLVYFPLSTLWLSIAFSFLITNYAYLTSCNTSSKYLAYILSKLGALSIRIFSSFFQFSLKIRLEKLTLHPISYSFPRSIL